MKVKKIKLKKFKKLENFESLIDCKNIYIIGENGMGKSSIMQAIKIAMGDNTVIPDDQGKFEVLFDNDGEELKAIVTISNGSSKIEIHSSNGSIFTKKSDIKELFGAVDFDPNKFVSWSETAEGRRKQTEFYKSLLDPTDIEELDRLQKNIENLSVQKTDIGRDIKNLDGSIKTHRMFENHNIDQYNEELDIEALIKKEINIDIVNETINQANAIILSNEKEILDLKEKIKKLESVNLEKQECIKKAEDWINNNKKEDIKKQLEELKKHNENVRLAKEFKQKENELAKFKKDQEELEERINKEKEDRKNYIRQMATCIDSLAFDEDQLYYNNMPVSHNTMSDSEILELGMRLQYAKNPKNQILCIESSNIIGKKRWDAIMEFASKNNLQVIAEKVERGAEVLSIEMIIE